MSDLRLSNAPKEQPRRGQCRELAPSLTGVTSVLELEAKILLAVSSWPKDVHERLLPGAFPAHVEIPALNNNEFEAHQRQPEDVVVEVGASEAARGSTERDDPEHAPSQLPRALGGYVPLAREVPGSHPRRKGHTESASHASRWGMAHQLLVHSYTSVCYQFRVVACLPASLASLEVFDVKATPITLSSTGFFASALLP